MKRFEEINGSKFDRLSPAEMSSAKGGRVCISCRKRTKSFEIGVEGSKWFFRRTKNRVEGDTMYDDMY